MESGPATVAPSPGPRTREPWEWKLPATEQVEWDGLSVWSDVIEAIYNGRRTGLRCPYCSEPLDPIEFDDPHVRVHCGQCGEGFEGRLG